VFEVYPGLSGEDRYRRLIEENGKPVPAEKLARQDRERQKTVETYARNIEKPAERQKADRKLDKDRREYADAVDDIFRIYDIAMVRREAVDGHDTIFATLTPKRGAQPRTESGKIMRHFRAKAWISESDYELVRVEIEAIDTLSFGLGLLARAMGQSPLRALQGQQRGLAPAEVTWTASGRLLPSDAQAARHFRVLELLPSVETTTTVSPPRSPDLTRMRLTPQAARRRGCGCRYNPSMAQWSSRKNLNTTDTLAERDRKTVWAGVRNPLAQKHLRSIRKGDRIFYYHTGKEKAVVAIAKATSDAYPDPADPDGKLFVVDIAPDKPFPPRDAGRGQGRRRVAAFPRAAKMRLSVMFVTDVERPSRRSRSR
jgi:hypothetical protein